MQDGVRCAQATSVKQMGACKSSKPAHSGTSKEGSSTPVSTDALAGSELYRQEHCHGHNWQGGTLEVCISCVSWDRKSHCGSWVSCTATIDGGRGGGCCGCRRRWTCGCGRGRTSSGGSGCRRDGCRRDSCRRCGGGCCGGSSH